MFPSTPLVKLGDNHFKKVSPFLSRYTVQYILFSTLQFTLYSIKCTVFSVHSYTVKRSYFIVYSSNIIVVNIVFLTFIIINELIII